MLGILERIRTKKKEITQTTADAYFALVRDVAGGSEVDVESAAIIIESANKDDAAFEKDVETQQARIGLAAKLKHKRELERQLPKLAQAERLASESYQRIVSEAATKLNAAQKAKRDIEHELIAMSQVEVLLRDSCLDTTLLARESELNAQRMKLIQQRRPLTEDLSRSQDLIKSYQSSVSALGCKSTDKNINPIGREAYKKELQQHERALEREQNVAKQLEQAITDIDSELDPIDRELATIRLKKLEV